MRAAAEFFGKDSFGAFDRKHADFFTVLFAEQGHCARAHGFFNRHLVSLHRFVAQNVIVHQAFDLFDFSVSQWLIMTEVETQIIRRDHRARLLDVRAQNLAQRRMHQVRRCMIASRRVALFDVNFSSDSVANFQGSFFDFDLVNDQTLSR